MSKFAPAPLFVARDDLRSGDLIALAEDELGLILMVPLEHRPAERGTCALSLRSFELRGFEPWEACLLTRAYEFALGVGVTSFGRSLPQGGEIAVTDRVEEPLLVTNSGQLTGFSLAGDRYRLTPGKTVYFHHWSIVLNGDSGPTELYRR